MTELKPCPTCKQPPRRGIWEINKQKQVAYFCTTCNIPSWIYFYETEEAAIAAWNKRVKEG
ncbi:MAG: Lar family restriction alleviation protein, partial [Tannerella sp.]|nr:Lar family restriction alleviation protein [Tannerella sp.]